MISAIDPGYQVFGRPAVHTGRDLIDTDCTVVLSFDLSRWGDVINVGSDQVMVNVRRSELPKRPGRGDTFTLSDVRLTVDQMLSATEYEYMMLAVEHDDPV